MYIYSNYSCQRRAWTLSHTGLNLPVLRDQCHKVSPHLEGGLSALTMISRAVKGCRREEADCSSRLLQREHKGGKQSPVDAGEVLRGV